MSTSSDNRITPTDNGVPRPGDPPGEAWQEVDTAGQDAAAAGVMLRQADDRQIRLALSTAADLLVAAGPDVAAANAADVCEAEAVGMSAGLLDRLRLDPARVEGAAQQLRELAVLPVPATTRHLRDLPDGTSVHERMIPLPAIGAIYEARPAVTLDVAGQLLRARSAAVLRTGSASLRTAARLVDDVLVPALANAGLPERSVVLLREPGRVSAEALVSRPDLLPLVIVRGSGQTTRELGALAATSGVRVLAHADGGGVLYADSSSDPAMLARLIAASVDRLGVCNRLNLLLVHRDRWRELTALATQVLAVDGVAVSVPPHAHRLGHEWALDAGREATVTLVPVDGPEHAAALANAETSGLAAAVCAEDAARATAFLAAWDGAGAFWNTPTRWLDGYRLLGLPETGINVDRFPGPRGPVTFPDLALRQFLVLPPGANATAEALDRQ